MTDKLDTILTELETGGSLVLETGQTEYGAYVQDVTDFLRAKLRAAMEMEKVVTKVIIAGCCFNHEKSETYHYVFRSDIEEAKQVLAAWRRAGEEK